MFVAGICSSGIYPSSPGFAKAGPRSEGDLCIIVFPILLSSCRGDHKGRPYNLTNSAPTDFREGLLGGGDGKLNYSKAFARGSRESGLAMQEFSISIWTGPNTEPQE